VKGNTIKLFVKKKNAKKMQMTTCFDGREQKK
jgi:hypothetical protein